MSDFLLYGSYGYTGRLVARQAVKSGLRPLLAGRNREAVAAQAAELGLPFRALPLADEGALEEALSGVPAVLHCAGPFQHTFRNMAEACVRTATHYLDITGEISVFEALAVLGHRAEEAGTMLLPGAGFDVVPSDCLAAHLKRRLPSASRLRLAICALGSGISRGTATTMAENIGRGGLVRKDGVLKRVPNAWRTREVDFGQGPVWCVTIPWGDVSSAFYSTGIGDVEVYAAVSKRTLRLMRTIRPLGPFLSTHPVQRLMKSWIRRQRPGPSAEARERGEARVWGEVEDERGRRVASWLRTPEGYTLTARTAVAMMERVLRGEAVPGFQTPSRAFGPDFILQIEGVDREDRP